MTVTTTARLVIQTGNGSTTEWPFAFEVPLATDLVVQTRVIATGVVTVISSSDYTVTGIGLVVGGTVTYPLSGSPLASTVEIIISRVVPLTQLLDINNQDGFNPEVVEDEFDSVVFQTQQLDDDLQRAFKVPFGETMSVSLPKIADRLSKYFFFDAAGNPGVSSDAPPTATQDLDTRTALAAATVDGAINIVITAGYSAFGDGGGAIYERVGSDPSTALSVQSTDGAWWKVLPDHGYVNVKQAGAVGDNVTDDGAAFIACLEFAELQVDTPSTGLASTYGVIVPPSDNFYYLGANTLELKAAVHLVGQGTGMAGNNPCRLRWDANITGIIVHRANTIGATTEVISTDYGADGSKIEGLHLDSDGGTIAGVTDSTKGHGIWLRARATLIDVIITDFPGNGINIVAQAGGAADVEGNANNWRIDRARITGCHKNGLFVDGPDTNAGVAQSVDVGSNGRWGIHDSSFLGNTYIGSHASNCGLATAGENGAGESSMVSFGGNLYSANGITPASEADLVATTPGTDETIWFLLGAGSPGGGQPLWVTAQSEGTYFLGGPYYSEGVSSRNVFIGTYVESGQGVIQAKIPAAFFGGLTGTVKGTTTVYGSSAIQGLLSFPNHQSYSPSRDLTVQINNAVNQLLSVKEGGGHASGMNVVAWDESGKAFKVFEYANSVRAMHITSNLYTNKRGRDAEIGGGQILHELGFWLGPNGKHFSSGTAARTTGDRAVGDYEKNDAPSAGEPIGWVCITAHATNPTFMAIYGVADQTSHADQAALTDSTGGSANGTLDAISGSGADAAINKNFQELHLLMDQIRTTLVGTGHMKGSA